MITLLTDFGTADYFAAAVKGVILTLNPHAAIIDLTHEIPAQDIACAAFTLGACWRDFPPGTVHLAVVDPGVGSQRRAIVVAAGGQFFVGPDNGVFSYVYECERDVQVFHATKAEFFRPPVSATFHGRDVFAPLAAWLSRGLKPAAMGAPIDDYVAFAVPQPTREPAGDALAGEIIHLDRFGNCVTNFTERELSRATATAESFTGKLLLGTRTVARFGTHYAASQSGEPCAYLGSAGYWEIGVWCASAAELCGWQRGTKIILNQSAKHSDRMDGIFQAGQDELKVECARPVG